MVGCCGWGYQYISDQDIIVYLTKSKEKMVQLHRFFSYLAVHPKAFAIHPSSFFIFLTSRFDVDQYHQQWTNVLKVWSNELIYSCFGQCSYNYRFDQFWSLKIDVNFICMTYIYKGKPKLLNQLQRAKMIINML